MKRFTFVLWLCLTACSRSRNGTIIVGSKNFTEQLLLGEIAAQQLERKLHVPVKRRLGLGGTLLTHGAILDGSIDVYPEYTGTAASVVLKQKTSADHERVYQAVKNGYERFHLVWLSPLGFNNTFAMVVRTTDARKLPQATLSEARSRPWKLGIGFEFLTRPDGLGRLDKFYDIHWSGLPKSMDLGLLYRALTGGQIDMAAAASTDAQLSQPQFTMLKDDKGAFPPYDACYVVRQDLLQQRPEVDRALRALEGRINDGTMRGLNRLVDIEHQPVAKVARDFLTTLP